MDVTYVCSSISKKANDRVPLELLVQKMKERDTPAGVMSLVISLFSRTAMRVAVNGELTERIETYRGLFQGSLLSPFLFLVFIDDLAETLSNESTEKWPNNLLFPDDLELIAPDFGTAQHLCDLVSIWSLENCLKDIDLAR
jgi:hypothetical protein